MPTHRTRPAAPATTVAAEPGRALAMPKRTHTRNRQHAIETERQLNNDYLAERNKPPPF